MDVSLGSLLWENLVKTGKIALMVVLLMIGIEWLELRYKDAIRKRITYKPFNQYIIASLLGVIPGCLDAFFIISLYTHGIVGFGALVAVMISTAGDEAFVMFSLFPKQALLISGFCFVLGVVGGFLADVVVQGLRLQTCESCVIETHSEGEVGHFFHEHIINHIIKKHLPKLLLWLFGGMVLIDLFMRNFGLNTLLPANKLVLMVMAALVGILPESGPHLVFTLLYAEGMIPLSALLVNSIVQDGHGLLPLLSYTVRDAVLVKVFNVILGLIIGAILIYIKF